MCLKFVSSIALLIFIYYLFFYCPFKLLESFLLNLILDPFYFSIFISMSFFLFILIGPFKFIYFLNFRPYFFTSLFHYVFIAVFLLVFMFFLFFSIFIFPFPFPLILFLFLFLFIVISIFISIFTVIILSIFTFVFIFIFIFIFTFIFTFIFSLTLPFVSLFILASIFIFPNPIISYFNLIYFSLNFILMLTSNYPAKFPVIRYYSQQYALLFFTLIHLICLSFTPDLKFSDFIMEMTKIYQFCFYSHFPHILLFAEAANLYHYQLQKSIHMAFNLHFPPISWSTHYYVTHSIRLKYLFGTTISSIYGFPSSFSSNFSKYFSQNDLSTIKSNPRATGIQ